MFALERQQRIRGRLEDRGRVAVGDLARDFATSQETIRRDLAVLEESGDLRRVHGGAVDPARAGVPPMAARAAIRVEEKRRIARAALDRVPASGSMLLESASTSLVLAEMLPAGLPVTIVTNGVEIAHHLAARGFDVVTVGGRVRNRGLAALDDWVRPGLDADPREVRNLWDDPAHAEVKRGLVDEILRWRTETAMDPAPLPATVR